MLSLNVHYDFYFVVAYRPVHLLLQLRSFAPFSRYTFRLGSVFHSHFLPFSFLLLRSDTKYKINKQWHEWKFWVATQLICFVRHMCQCHTAMGVLCGWWNLFIYLRISRFKWNSIYIGNLYKRNVMLYTSTLDTIRIIYSTLLRHTERERERAKYTRSNADSHPIDNGFCRCFAVAWRHWHTIRSS